MCINHFLIHLNNYTLGHNSPWPQKLQALLHECRIYTCRILHTSRKNHHDYKHPTVLKDLADVVVKSLTIILENSWLLGQVLGDWKKRNITPFSKKGRKEDVGDYRPGGPPWWSDSISGHRKRNWSCLHGFWCCLTWHKNWRDMDLKDW